MFYFKKIASFVMIFSFLVIFYGCNNNNENDLGSANNNPNNPNNPNSPKSQKDSGPARTLYMFGAEMKEKQGFVKTFEVKSENLENLEIDISTQSLFFVTNNTNKDLYFVDENYANNPSQPPSPIIFYQAVDAKNNQVVEKIEFIKKGEEYPLGLDIGGSSKRQDISVIFNDGSTFFPNSYGSKKLVPYNSETNKKINDCALEITYEENEKRIKFKVGDDSKSCVLKKSTSKVLDGAITGIEFSIANSSTPLPTDDFKESKAIVEEQTNIINKIIFDNDRKISFLTNVHVFLDEGSQTLYKLFEDENKSEYKIVEVMSEKNMGWSWGGAYQFTTKDNIFIEKDEEKSIVLVDAFENSKCTVTFKEKEGKITAKTIADENADEKLRCGFLEKEDKIYLTYIL